MTIKEAIDLLDELRPNAFDQVRKRHWLSNLDGQIHQDVILTHMHTPQQETFAGYDDADDDTVLLVPAPFAEDIYNLYLQMMVDKENGEIRRYNQTATMFNAALSTYQDWYNRTHLPLGLQRFMF